MTPFSVVNLPKSPWKNGGGLTRELSIGPPGADIGAFDWRVTLADIEPGDFSFSYFAGVDRTMVVTGTGMRMAKHGSPRSSFVPVEPFAPFAPLPIPGEEALDATLEGAAIQAFNLVVRRDVANGRVSVHRQSGVLSADTGIAVFYCARGEAELEMEGAKVALHAGQALQVRPAGTGTCVLACRSADAIVLAATIELQGLTHD